MIQTIERIFPLFLYMLLGIICKQTGTLDKETALKVNKLVFRLLIPIHLFLSTAKSSAFSADLIPPIAYAIGVVTATFLLAWIFYAHRDYKDNEKSILIQTSYRSNFALFGMTLTNMLLTENRIGISEILVAFTIPMYNIYTVLLFQYYSKQEMSLKSALLGIIKNPLIQGIFYGYAFKLTGLTLPQMLEAPLARVGSMCTPLALIALGACFSFKQSKDYIKPLMEGVFVRLILVPTLCIGGAILLGFRGEPLIAYIALFASPVAVSSYSMAVSMDQDYELAGQMLVYSSLLSVVSLFVIIHLLSSFALI